MGEQVIYWGEGKDIERDLSTSYQIDLKRPKNGHRMIRGFHLFKMTVSLGLKQRPKMILCFGGFSSFVLGVYALVFRVPLFLFEQNRISGRVNRFLSVFARKTFLTFPESERDLKTSRYLLTGNPVRPIENHLKKEIDLLIVGGSQGAKALNQTLPKLLPKNLNIVHISGPGRQVETEKVYQEHAFVKYKVLETTNELPLWMSKSKWVISRAGATSIAEAAATGSALMLVPYPYAKDNHQKANADYLVSKDAALVLEESELESSSNSIHTYLKDNSLAKQCSDHIQELTLVDIDGKKAIRELKNYF